LILMSQAQEIMVDEETYELTQKCEVCITQMLRFALDALITHYETQDRLSKSA